MDDTNPHVHVLATGGTIANPPDMDGYLSGADLVSNISELGSIAEITCKDIRSIASTCITPEVWYDIHKEISQSVESNPPDGFVITHGSNTIEETAYFLNLTLQTEIPVVLTAAQRNHQTVGNDGDRNLVDAARVAADTESRSRGVLVVVNDEIHQARDVTKAVSSRPDAWTSGNLGVVGLIDKHGRLNYYRQSERKHTSNSVFDIKAQGYPPFPNIQIVYSAAGTDGQITDLLTNEPDLVDGIVVAALPTGAPSRPVDKQTQSEALRSAVDAGIPVVVSHRGLDGWVYEYDPFIRGDTLTPQKSRILLGLALQKTSNKQKIQSYFKEY
jgi:L-asparaginase